MPSSLSSEAENYTLELNGCTKTVILIANLLTTTLHIAALAILFPFTSVAHKKVSPPDASVVYFNTRVEQTCVDDAQVITAPLRNVARTGCTWLE